MMFATENGSCRRRLLAALFFSASLCGSLAYGSTDTWVGTTGGSAAWDTSSNNWDVNGTLGAYTEGDAVIFSDIDPLTGEQVSSTTINIQTSGVSPASVVFTNSFTGSGGLDYTLTGGSINGSGGLTFAETPYIDASSPYIDTSVTLTLATANSYTGQTAVYNGTLLLTGSIATSGSSAPLLLGSGTLSFNPGSGMPTTQSFNGVSLSPGASAIVAASGATVNAGAITIAAGSILDINGGGATGSVITSNTNNSAGILGGWATYNGADWAVANGSGAIAPLASYTTLPSSATTAISAPTANYSLSGSGTISTGANVTVNSLKLLGDEATLTIGTGDTTLSVSNGSGGSGPAGGLLNAGTSGYTISGGILAAGSNVPSNPNSELLINVSQGANLIVSSAITAGTTNSLTKSGPGTLTLEGYNTYMGPTTVSEGVLAQYLDPVPLAASGPLVVNSPGVVNFGGPFVSTAYVAGLSGNGIVDGSLFVMSIPAGVTETFSGGIGGGQFNLVGAGTQVLSGASGSGGAAWEVDAGTLQLGPGTALATSATGGPPDLFLGGGTLALAGTGQSQQIHETYLTTGASSIVVPAGDTLNLGSFAPEGAEGVVNVNTGGSTSTVLTSDGNNYAGILGGWATFGGLDWATVNGSGQIVAYTGYASGAPSGDNAYTNYSLFGSGTVTIPTGTTVPNTVVANSLKITGNGTLTIPYGVTLMLGTGGSAGVNGGGILFANSGSPSTYTIAAGTGTGGYATGLTAYGYVLYIDVYYNGIGNDNILTISAPITDAALVKSGGGSLFLTGQNSYESTYLDAGILVAGSMAAVNPSTFTVTPGNLGYGPIDFAGGALSFAALSGGFDITAASHSNGGASPNPITIDAAGGTIDTDGNDVAFSNPLGTANGGSPGALTKVGTGALVLTGAQLYTGGTNVYGGQLLINNGGSLATGPVAVGSGATASALFGGYTGTVTVGGPVTVNAGGILAPGWGGGGGTLLISDDLTLKNGSYLSFNVGSDLINLNNAPYDTLTIGTGITLYNTATTDPGDGTYHLIHYGTLIDDSSGFSGWTVSAPGLPVHSYSFYNDTAGDYIDLVVGPALVWTGTASGSWDTSGSVNWASGSPPTATTYFDGAGVVFGDKNPITGVLVPHSSGLATVSIQSGGVSPGVVEFTNTGAANGGVDYSLGGGPIAGSASLTLNGAPNGSGIAAGGSVTLTTPNSYTGGTTVNAGTLSTTGSGTIGPSALAINAASGVVSAANLGNSQTVSSLSGTVASGGSATLGIAAGTTLTVNQSSNTTFAGVVNIAAGTSGSFGTLAVANVGTLEIDAAPTLGDYAALNVSQGTLGFNVSAGSAMIGTGVTATVASAATLQLAGSVSALSDPTSGNLVNVANNGSTASGGGFLVTGTNQSVGTVIGSSSTGAGGVITYAGDTVVGDGIDPADLTATQILQNTLTINAGATVTIAPSGPGIAETDEGDSFGDRDRADSGENLAVTELLAAIDDALDSDSITAGTGGLLDRHALSVGRVAADDPGVDVTILEAGILAEIPTTDWPASDDLAAAEADATLLDEGIIPPGVFSDAAAGAFAPSPVPEPPSVILAILAIVGMAIALRRGRTQPRWGRIFRAAFNPA